MRYIFILCFYVTAVTAATSNCPAQKPCLCDGLVISCDQHNLYTVPTFRTVQGHFRILKLSNNNIQHIPANVFASLNVTTILLDHNQINAVDASAFAGVVGTLHNLDLSHNRLVQLPPALSTLGNLKQLDISWNPLHGPRSGHHHSSSDGLTDSVMREIGDSITNFTFGDSSLTWWPTSLNHLNQLEELKVSGSNLSYWPAGSFHGFEHTLKKLTIEYAALGAIPLGIAQLTLLQELHLDHLNVPGQYGQIPFNDDSMISAPFGPIANTLKVLSLNYDGLTTFPEVIKDLTSLNSLSLDGNDLQFVSDEAITLLKQANVSFLSVKNCNLKRVPGAISDLSHLLELDLSQNNIRSIESTDLQNLFQLRSLSLSQNPLKYISDNSLCGLNNLRVLNLFNTSLTILSKSFQNLRKLTRLDLQESNIDCTCDITWIALWKQKCQDESTVEIEGKCETIEMGILDYINMRLPTCPDYALNFAKNYTCGGNCVAR